MKAAAYKAVTEQIVDHLRRIVGPANVIYAQPERLEPYSHDEIPEPTFAHLPDCVVLPESAEQIAEILKLANRQMIPVTPRGAGSGLSGGAVPIAGGICLSLERMNRILEIDEANMMAVVEPGVITNDINVALKGRGLWYAGYPMSLETCFIGGNVAENAGGGRAVKYGVTGRYVTGLEVVTPNGQVVNLGGKHVKDVTGYDLIALMVGSEGTLGVFTKITLKLMPQPKASIDLLCLFPTVEAAISAVPTIQTGGGVIPTAIEFMDASAVRHSCRYLNETIPYGDAGAMLLITVDGPDEPQVVADSDAVGEYCMASGATEIYVADNATTSSRIWKLRSSIGEALGLLTTRQSAEDLVVPVAQIPDLVKAMGSLAEKFGLMIPCYGHAGDGNMHTRIMAPADWSAQRWHTTLPQILTELYRITAGLGGTISGEHGIGHKRKPYMPLVLSQPALDLMRAVKRAIDPNNILNPGKIIDL